MSEKAKPATSALNARLGVNSIEADFALIRRYHDVHMDSPFKAQSMECLERIEEELKRLTPRKKGPMHSCDDPLCAVCGNPYA